MALAPLRHDLLTHAPVTSASPRALTLSAPVSAPRHAPPQSERLPASPAADTDNAPEADSLRESLEQAKESSLLYQLVRSLLLRPEDAQVSTDAPVSRQAEAAEWQFSAESVFSESLQFELRAADGSSFQFSASQTVQIALEVTQTAEGWTIRFSQSVEQQINLSVSNGRVEPARKDPLLLDLDGDGLETSGRAAPVRFDLDADGFAEWISAAAGGDAFLALDRNGNGQIDNGRELFGEQHGAAHGFAELLRFDDNKDWKIDAQDPVFKDLKLLNWGNGQTRQRSLTDAGIRALSLNWTDTHRILANGDQIAQRARFQFADGREQELADVWVQHWRA